MDTELYRKGQARVDEANKQALSGQVGGALTKEGIISQNGTDPITSTTLTSTPEVKLPTTQPTSSIADGVIASTTASADQFQKEAERVVAEQNKGQQAIQQERETTLGKIKGLFGQTSDLQAQRAEAEKLVDPSRAELANINKEIADQNVALRGETDAIMARGDVSREGQQSLLQNVKDTYGRRLADLAIRQSAANQNVTALETALDRKLELATASIKNDIEYYKDFELANLDILSKEERQRVQDIVAEKNRQLETNTRRETAISNILKTASENGVRLPDTVVNDMLKARNDVEAYQILANRGYTLAKPQEGGIAPTQSPYQIERQTRVLESIADLKKRVNLQTTGILSLGRIAPGSIQRDFASDLSVLKSNIISSELTAMREASKTGGALGNVSDRESEFLSAALGALDQGQSPENFRKNLQRIEDSIKRWQQVAQTVGGGTVGTSEEAQLAELGYTAEQIQEIKNAK